MSGANVYAFMPWNRPPEHLRYEIRVRSRSPLSDADAALIPDMVAAELAAHPNLDRIDGLPGFPEISVTIVRTNPEPPSTRPDERPR